jgi:hypothetical protein
MKIAMTGSSGLIGTALRASLAADGHEVVRLVRRPSEEAHDVSWDPGGGELGPSSLAGIDAAVNLAGVGIGDKRWTDAHKRAVLDSRLDATDLLSRTLAELDTRPRAMISASAIGYYGGRGDEVLTEDSDPGSDFVAGVCVPWEAATAPASRAGIRVVHLRTGLVMSKDGGILEQLLLPFKLGLGGRIGSGDQYWSWIDIDDEIAAIRFLLGRDDLSGPFNLTAPNPLPFGEVVKILGKVLRRPTILPAPSLAMKALFGAERAESLLFDGQRALPQRLLDAGFSFQFTQLEESLRHQLGG